MVIATGWIIAGGIILLIIVLLALPVRVLLSYDKDLQLRVKYLFFTLYAIPSNRRKKAAKKKQEEHKQAEAAEAPEDTLKQLSEEENSEAEQSHKHEEKPEISTERVTEKKAGVSENISVETPQNEDKNTEKPDTIPEKQDKPEKQKKPKKSKKPKQQKPPSKIPTLDELIALLRALVDGCGKPLKKLGKRIKICDLYFESVCGGEDAAQAALNFGKTNLLVSNTLGWCCMAFTVKNPQVNINVDFQSEVTITKVSCIIKLSALAALAFLFSLLFRVGWRVLRNGTIMDYITRLRGGTPNKLKAKKKSK